MKPHERQHLSRMFQISALCSISIFLSSCAILSVDVDVYKGPLMNEQAVQVQQLEAIRIAAIPLLVTLRDSIEWRDSGGRLPEGINNYTAGYIKDPKTMEVTKCTLRQKLFTACKEGEGFRNPIAQRVNEVIGYYQGSPRQDTDSPFPHWADLSKNYLDEIQSLKAQRFRSDVPKNTTLPIESNPKLTAAHKAYAQLATRTLFLANHDGLLTNQNSSGLIFGGLGNLGRGLVGDSVFEAVSPGVYWDNIQGIGTLERRTRTQYVRVLQAVGNSMLTLVNELIHDQEALENGRLRAKTEAAAIESAFIADPFKVYINLLHELEEEQKGQAALVESLKGRLNNIATEMDMLEDTASQKTDATNWARGKTDTENALRGTPTGAFILLDMQKIDSAFQTLTGKPASQEEAWNAIYTQTHKALQNDELIKKAKEHLATLQGDSNLNLLTESYFVSWKLVKEKLQAQRTAFENKKKALDVLNRLLALFTEKDEKTKFEKIAEGRKTALDTTHTIVKGAKNKVLEELANQKAFISSKGVYLTLAIALEAIKKAETDIAKQVSIQTAMDEMNKRTPPPSFAITPNLSDAKEVLDQEIALLRQEHIQAVRNGGTDSEPASKALATIETALQHRAGMVRLRPAAAYLRTSYPSTSLQDDPNLSWDNLLLQQGLRDVPFSTYLVELFNPDKKRDESISAELDKQYWQNINRVRVSGMGTTNYVLAKDDVGNWYVKHYSGDTGQIFESARKLGMFNLAGAGANTSLLSSLNKQIGPNDESPSASQTTPLQRVFDRHRTTYETQTKTDLTTMHDLTIGDGLRTAIRDGWKPLFSDPNEPTENTLTTLLLAPSTQLKESIAKIERDDKTRPGVKVVQSLQAVHSFHRAVRINIQNLQEDKMDTGKKKSALALLAHTLQDKLSSFTDNRQHLIQEYEQAIMFIGDATDNSNADAKQSK